VHTNNYDYTQLIRDIRRPLLISVGSAMNKPVSVIIAVVRCN